MKFRFGLCIARTDARYPPRSNDLAPAMRRSDRRSSTDSRFEAIFPCLPNADRH